MNIYYINFTFKNNYLEIIIYIKNKRNLKS